MSKRLPEFRGEMEEADYWTTHDSVDYWNEFKDDHETIFARASESHMQAETLPPDMIDAIVRRLVAAYQPLRVILFGSYATGRADADSDIDLLIIKETSRRPIDRWVEAKRILRDRNRRTPISPLVLTPAELADRIAAGDYFVRGILAQGRVLYG